MTDMNRRNAVLLTLLAPFVMNAAAQAPEPASTMTMPDMGPEMNKVHW